MVNYIYFDNYGDAAKSADAEKILLASGVAMPGITHNIHLEPLDLDGCVNLFCERWTNTNRDNKIEDNEELWQFLKGDLEQHQLSIVLVAIQSGQGRLLDELKEDWRQNARVLAGKKLDFSMMRALGAVKHRDLAAVYVWGVAAFFPHGLCENALSFIVKNATNANAGKLINIRRILTTLHILKRRSGDGRYYMLSPIRKFTLKMAREQNEGLDINTIAPGAYDYFMHLAVQTNKSFEKHNYNLEKSKLLEEFLNIHSFMLFETGLGESWESRLLELGTALENYYEFEVGLGINILKHLRGLVERNGNGYNKYKAVFCRKLGELMISLGDEASEIGKLLEEAARFFIDEKDDIGLAKNQKKQGDFKVRFKPSSKDYEAAVRLYEEAAEYFEVNQDNH